MRALKVLKRDTHIANIRTLVRQEISQSNRPTNQNSRGSAIGSLGSASTSTPGTGTGGTAPTVVHAYNVTGSPSTLTVVTRSAIKPVGAVYFWDDSVNDRVEMRYDSINDPLTFIF